ncbi:hypothetical protein B0O80DRAFT_121432 [Mortierella sp. GBAus27b]|nr:hypothetical protein B0O80DRAFT_121432 [Mortierella sp. GBAus27b]
MPRVLHFSLSLWFFCVRKPHAHAHVLVCSRHNDGTITSRVLFHLSAAAHKHKVVSYKAMETESSKFEGSTRKHNEMHPPLRSNTQMSSTLDRWENTTDDWPIDEIYLLLQPSHPQHWTAQVVFLVCIQNCMYTYIMDTST